MEATTGVIWLIVTPFATAFIVYLIGRILARRSGAKLANRISAWLAALGLLISAYPLYLEDQIVLSNKVVLFKQGGIIFYLDGISVLLAVVVLLLGLLVVIFSARYMSSEVGAEKYYALLLAMIGGILGLGCSADLFTLWVWFEVMAITSYMLVAFYRSQPASLEAGFKYLVQSAAGSVFVLIGIFIVFAWNGTLDMMRIRYFLQPPLPSILLVAGGCFLIGFGVKAALVPLHTWLPDAHSQAPSGISAMLSGIVIEAGLIALLRVTSIMGAASELWGNLMLGVGALNMLLGNLMALRQTQVKRLLAYSSIGHMGYMMFGLGVIYRFGILNGAGGAFFHLFNHAMMKGLAFLAAGVLLYVLYIAKGDHGTLTLDDLNGASKRYPLTVFTLSVALLGLGGLPPLAGFMSKWQIFVAGFQTQDTVAMLLVVFAALNSVLSLGYYAPLVNRMYRLRPSAAVENGAAVPKTMVVPLVVLTLLIVVLGFYPSLLNWLTEPAAGILFLFIRG
ncbi:MAG: proton-conducting transporter membrane subunit [Anaerolineales bacterium]